MVTFQVILIITMVDGEQGLTDNTFAIGGTPSPDTTPASREVLPQNSAVTDILLKHRENTIGRVPTPLGTELNKFTFIAGLQNAPDGKEYHMKDAKDQPLVIATNGVTPLIQEVNGQYIVTAPGTKDAISITAIKQKLGDTVICVDGKGEEVTVPIAVLRDSQIIQVLDQGKKEQNAFTPQEQAQLNQHLIDSGFIPTDSGVASLEKHKIEQPEALAEDADEVAKADYQKGQERANAHNDSIDKLIAKMQDHAVLTEGDLGDMIKLQGQGEITRLQQGVSTLDKEIAEKRKALIALAETGTDAGLNGEIEELLAQKKQLQTELQAALDRIKPETIAQLFNHTRTPEMARQVSDALENGNIESAMNAMMQAHLDTIQDAAEKEATQKLLEQQKKKQQEMATMLGGGAALLLLVIFMESMKQSQ